jgi:hypothetical protein
MSRCTSTDAILEAIFTETGLSRTQAAHVAECGTCARDVAAARRFGVELNRAADLIVADAEADGVLRHPAPAMRGGMTMRQLLAVAAIVAVVAITAASYMSGRWIGSFVEIGFDHSSPLLDERVGDEGDGAGDEEDRAGDQDVERARAQAEEAAVRAEAARRAREEAMRRAAAEAERRAEERIVLIPDPQADGADAALANARCEAWATMTEDEQLRVVEVLVGGAIEQVRVRQQLPEGAERPAIIAGARASLDKGCQGSPGDRELVVIARWLYGEGN